MKATSPSVSPPEPGRLARPVTAAASGWQRWLPGFLMLRRYEAAWLRNDIVAGLVLTTMLVPVGIAYAEASGVPGVYGLYATVLPPGFPPGCFAGFRPQSHPGAGARLFPGRRDSGSRASPFRG